MNVNYGAWTYGPPIMTTFGYNFAYYSQTAFLTGTTDTPVDPTWANLDQGNSRTKIQTSNVSHAGQYTFTIRYMMDNEPYPLGSYGDAIFQIYLVAIL